jgi:hypothetical protein
LLQDDKVERGQGVGAETEEERNNLVKLTTSDDDGTLTKSSWNVTSVVSSLVPGRTVVDLTTGTRWTSLNEVPDDVTSLTVEDVVDCLRLLNLHKYVNVFREQQIDGALLTSLDQQLLVNEFQFKRFDALKLEKFACHRWRPKFNAQPPPHSDC